MSAKRIGKRKMRKGPAEKAFIVANTTFLTLLCLLTIYPIFYIVVYSLNEGMDSLKGGLFLWPREFTWFNYEYVLGNGIVQRAYLTTIARTILGTALGLVVTGIAAYGYSFRNLPYRKFLMGVALVPMLFNGGLIPYYIQLNRLHLVDTFWVFVIPGAFNIWNMFVMMKFFMGIPESLRESALIDGAGEVSIFLKIIIPLSKPVIAAIGLFVAVSHWNDWYSGAFYINSNKLMPLQTYLQKLFSSDSLSMLAGNNQIVAEAAIRQSQTSNMTIMSVKMAAVMVGTLPILCVYPFLQKHFVKGMLVGSVKG